MKVISSERSEKSNQWGATAFQLTNTVVSVSNAVGLAREIPGKPFDLQFGKVNGLTYAEGSLLFAAFAAYSAGQAYKSCIKMLSL